MNLPEHIVPTPWDERALGIATYQIERVSEETLAAAAKLPGHFTVKLDPQASTRLLHEHGFYYCDTLIEPYCIRRRFVPVRDGKVSLATEVSLAGLLAISHGAFTHGRFHRDFNVARSVADARYDNWLRDLQQAGSVFGLQYDNELAAFFAYQAQRIVLHAMAAQFKGRGLAKALWTAACERMFDAGHAEISSSISAANMAALNLYASLGFGFRNPLDVYHRLNRPAAG